MADFFDIVKRCGEDAQAMGWNNDVPMAKLNSPEMLNWINTKLLLVVSEAVEASDELRNGRKPRDIAFELDKNGNDKPIGFPTELADIVVRVMHLSHVLAIDLEAVVTQKLDYNLTRGQRHGGKLF